MPWYEACIHLHKDFYLTASSVCAERMQNLQWKTKKKPCCTIYTKEKEGRFNLKIGTHSLFRQMKARKWKNLESCLVWKSKVMNNASVSIIKSVLTRWISQAPAGSNAHTAALLTNQEWDKSPRGPWTSHILPVGPSPVCRSEQQQQQTAQACHLCPWIHLR